jgi:hypothetical protein
VKDPVHEPDRGRLVRILGGEFYVDLPAAGFEWSCLCRRGARVMMMMMVVVRTVKAGRREKAMKKRNRQPSVLDVVEGTDMKIV